MKGIVLAGGRGTRLAPLTNVISKQLLPVYDKPMIYYPIATLMAAQIKEICIISSPEHLQMYIDLLGTGENWGVSFEYLIQEEPKGIPQAFIIAKDFIGGNKCALILGDNIFVGPGMGRVLQTHQSVSGAHVMLYPVKNPNDYGIAELDENGAIISLEEKPEFPKSQLALTGLAFVDESAVQFAEELAPSKRGELELTEFLMKYMEKDSLSATQLDRGTAWLDMGQIPDLFAAAEFIKVIQERQGLRISIPEEISWRNNWISTQQLHHLGELHPNKNYGQYLQKLNYYKP